MRDISDLRHDKNKSMLCMFVLLCRWLVVSFYCYCFLGSFFTQAAFAADSDSNVPDTCRIMEFEHDIKDKATYHREAFAPYEGRTIGDISIVVNDVFDETDPREDKALYRLVNNIQINTKKSTIRNQLLFTEGDTINALKVEESIRILFGREYVMEAFAYVHEDCANDVNITIVIRDAWVIEPVFSYGREGGETSSNIGFRDANFLGSGNEVSLLYESNAERNKVIYRYKTHNFLGQRWEADFYHAELSDGVDSRFALEKPFYSANTLWAYGLESGSISLEYNTRYSGDIINKFTQKVDVDSLFLGKAIEREDEHSHRIKVGWTQENMTFSELDNTNLLPENEEQIYPWIEFERITNNYRRYENFSYIGRESDVPVGTDFRVRVGVGHFGNGERLYRVLARYSAAVSYSDTYVFQMNSSADLLREDATDSLRNSVVSVEGRYHYFINDKNRWYVKVGLSRGYNLAQFRQLAIGEVEGVRGYPLAYQRGDKRYVLNVERRFYSDLHWLNIVRLGAVVFFDMGRAWGIDEFPSDDVLKSVGFGLRLHSSKVGNPSVVHMNVGFPILNDSDDLNDALFSISVESQF